jgi:hypothetical protein
LHALISGTRRLPILGFPQVGIPRQRSIETANVDAQFGLLENGSGKYLQQHQSRDVTLKCVF